MQNIEIKCSNCDNIFWYWTINNYITCQGCKTQIPVEPCTPEEEIALEGEKTPLEGEEDGTSV